MDTWIWTEPAATARGVVEGNGCGGVLALVRLGPDGGKDLEPCLGEKPGGGG
jgi:hypothetical protein